MSLAVVLEQKTLRRGAVLARYDPAADEEIDMPIAVEVARHDARAVVEELRQRMLGARQVSVAVIQIEPIPQRRTAHPIRTSRRKPPIAEQRLKIIFGRLAFYWKEGQHSSAWEYLRKVQAGYAEHAGALAWISGELRKR